MELPNIGAFAVLGFVGLITIEMIAVRLTGRGRYETKDTFASLSMGVGNSIASALGGGLLVYFVLSWVYQYRLIGYLCYDMLHYAIHHAPMKGKLWMALKTHHLKHHFKDPDNGYGVSSPIWDIIVGTQFSSSKEEK